MCGIAPEPQPQRLAGEAPLSLKWEVGRHGSSGNMISKATAARLNTSCSWETAGRSCNPELVSVLRLVPCPWLLALLSACSRLRRETRRVHPHLLPLLSTLEVKRGGNPLCRGIAVAGAFQLCHFWDGSWAVFQQRSGHEPPLCAEAYKAIHACCRAFSGTQACLNMLCTCRAHPP